MIRRTAGLALMAASLLATGASAQNRALRVIEGADVTVTYAPDDFSATDMGYVRIGKWQTHYYEGFELGVRAFRDKSNGEVLYTLYVYAPRLRAPGEITQVAARGGINFPRVATKGGRIHCSRYSCRQDVAGTFEIPQSVLEEIRSSGSGVDVRISTSCGRDCDIVQPISYIGINLLDQWAKTFSDEVGPTPPSDE